MLGFTKGCPHRSYKVLLSLIFVRKDCFTADKGGYHLEVKLPKNRSLIINYFTASKFLQVLLQLNLN